MTSLRVTQMAAARLLVALFLAAIVVGRTAAFSVPLTRSVTATSFSSSHGYTSLPSSSALFMSSRSRRYEEEDDDVEGDSDDRRYEYARVGRRRGREYRDEAEMDDAVGSSDRGRARGRWDEDDELGVDGTYAEYDDEYDDFLDDDDDEDFEEGILIPNPVLDSIDPEGASDRIGELISDPRWWRDVAVIAFLCLVVYVNTYDIDELVPWDVVTVDDFDIKAMYGPM